MHKLISELTRLYLQDGQQCHQLGVNGRAPSPAQALTPALLEQHLRGESTIVLDLVGAAKTVRAMVMDFEAMSETVRLQQWSDLCHVANALQTELGLPAPAVSINGHSGFRLWLSLETAVPAAQTRRFQQLLDKLLRPATELALADSTEWAAPPPCLNRASGKWAAFINPGMGGSFVEEPGLDMMPPSAAQAAFLESVHSISAAQFTQALDRLEQRAGAGTAAPAASAAVQVAPAPAATAAAQGLLLKDATLEDIIRHLHSKNIEPTFRHLL